MQNQTVPTHCGQDADTPVSHNMTRRAVLTGLPLAATATLPGAVLARPEREDTEIMRLFRKYRRIYEAAEAYVHEYNENVPMTEDEIVDELFYKHMRKIEDQMLALPSRTAQDVAAKISVRTCDNDFQLQYNDVIWQEIRQLLGVLPRKRGA